MEAEKLLTKNEIKTWERLKTVGKALEVFTDLWELGYTNREAVYTQLCINFPQYRDPKRRHTFGLLWNFVKYDRQMVKDLEATVDAINAK